MLLKLQVNEFLMVYAFKSIVVFGCLHVWIALTSVVDKVVT